MQFNLQGKRVLVTGSKRGIGRAIAESFLAQGARVMFNAREDASTAMKHLPSNENRYYFQADVSDPKQSQDLIQYCQQELGGLDTIVCNVGSGRSVPPGEETWDEWIKIFKLNFFSTTNIVEAALPTLKKSRGNIICVSSICGTEVMPSAPATYTAAKAALNAYINTQARVLAAFGVRMNGVAPGHIFFSEGTWDRIQKENPALVEQVLKTVPMNRFGKPEEIANAVIFLSSDLSSFTTGAILTIDGGASRSFNN